MPSSRLLIFIVAYNAEKTIRDVLARIPNELEQYETEVLIIDDASGDQTFEEALRHESIDDFRFPITILSNPTNQGYGGNQKLGFHYAINNGFDVVALVHGDGQYAPECLPDLVEPVANGEAHAVFGSRFVTPGGALKGRMPLYKFVGNRILTWIQNRLLKTSLTEFHTGFRIYSTSALSKLPFDLNHNDFHFDTEIIIQHFFGGFKIVERAIPTFYGDEISHVNGLKYAKDVVRETFIASVQKFGILYARKYDIVQGGGQNQPYNTKVEFSSSHQMPLNAIKNDTRVLDIGGVSEFIGRELKAKGCQVVVVGHKAPTMSGTYDEFKSCNLEEEPLPVDLRDFDVVLAIDVIEQLNRPEILIENLREAAKYAPNLNVILTTPNIGFALTRMMLFFGSFNYGTRGVLDLTHRRFFTFRTIRQLLEQADFKIESVRGVPVPFPLVFGDNVFSSILVGINRLLMKVSKGLFSYQIYISAEPLPSLDYLLQSAVEFSNDRREQFIRSAS
jgi:glycosyltransferase involved in cell wall biosynthesis